MKKVLWSQRARLFVKSLDRKVRRELGVLILLMQQGNMLGYPQARAIRIIHKNAIEIRLSDRSGQYRVIVVILDSERILIPHAFMKKTRKTPVTEIEMSKRSLRSMIDENK